MQQELHAPNHLRSELSFGYSLFNMILISFLAFVTSTALESSVILAKLLIAYLPFFILLRPILSAFAKRDVFLAFFAFFCRSPPSAFRLLNITSLLQSRPNEELKHLRDTTAPPLAFA